MRFAIILREINIAQIAILQLLFNKSNEVKYWFLMRGENWNTWGKKSQGRVESQQTRSTYHAGVLADLDPPRIGTPGPNPLADMDPPVHIR